MNAGAYNCDIGSVLSSVRCLDSNGLVIEFSRNDLNFGYRYSVLKDNGFICLDVTLNLSYGNRDEIMALMEDRKRRRIESQPLDFPSVGFVFRNSDNDYAGRIIEKLGFKRKCIGGAMVSVKHANFIVNYGNDSCSDIVALIDEVRGKVKEVCGIDLVLEQEIVK